MAEKRYSAVSAKKASGATYTPAELATFVADQMVKTVSSLDPDFAKRKRLRILDPAVGDGQLLDSLVARLREALPRGASLEVAGFDLDDRALRKARRRLSRLGAKTTVAIRKGDFLAKMDGSPKNERLFDFVIANPPYVRTQVMGRPNRGHWRSGLGSVAESICITHSCWQSPNQCGLTQSPE